MKLSNHMILAACSIILFSLISITYYPTNPSGVVYLKVLKKSTIQWDTGYGFNSIQSNVIPHNCRQLKLENMKLCKALHFYRWSFPDRIRVVNDQNSQKPEAYVIYSNDSSLKPIKLESNGDWLGVLPTAKYKFHFLSLLSYSVGLLLIGFLVYFVSLNLKLSYQKSFQALFLTSIIPYLSLFFILWLIYPGLLNPFNPVDIILNAEMYKPNFREGIILQLFWSSLYDVIRSPFFILTFQATSFLTALLFLWHKWSTENSKKLSFLTVLILAFCPLSLYYYGLLERSIANAYIFCLTILATSYFKLHKSKPSLHLSVVAFCCLALIMLRMDNIIFVIIFVFVFYWRTKLIYLLLTSVTLITLWFYSNIGESPDSIRSYKSINYINISLADSISRLYVNPHSREQALASSENVFFQKSLNFKAFPKSVDSNSDIHSIFNENNEPLLFLKNSCSLILKMPLQFLYVRALALKKTINDVASDGWNLATLNPNLYNLRFYMGDPKNIGTTLGHKSFSDFFRIPSSYGYIFQILIFTTLLFGLLIGRWFPHTGKVSFLISVKLIVLGIVIPVIAGRYAYEIFLAALVLPMIFWKEKQQKSVNH